jgi:hypothetical protein
VTLNERRAPTNKFNRARISLRPLRPDKLSVFILQILRLVIRESRRLQVIACYGVVAFSNCLCMLLPKLVDPTLCLGLPALLTPLRDFLLVAHVNLISSA